MRDTVVVFARAPRLGAVKRRLARDIGDRAALRFHVATLTRLLRGLAAENRFRTVLAITPDRARLSFQVQQIPQGGGNLGVRMHRVFRRFPRGRVAIIGCDIPDAGPPDLLAAFRGLGSADAVFGPAADGGYWLVAMSPRRPARPFACVRWSTGHALADTLANFADRRVAMLRTLHDVDTAADLGARLTTPPSPPSPASRERGVLAALTCLHRLATVPTSGVQSAPRAAIMSAGDQ